MMNMLAAIAQPVREQLPEVDAIIAGCLSEAGRALKNGTWLSRSAPGKRLRSLMVLLSGGAAGGLTTGHPKLAAATEIIHLATLAHDDVIDQAHVRRGNQTINATYGNSIAVILGDHLLSRAFELLAEFTNDCVLAPMVRMTREICEGELVQLRRRYDISLTEDEYLRIASQKTASLFAVSCRVSAALSGAEPAIQETIREAGKLFGMAYQIIDDCLDLVGDDAEKDRLKDLEGGKITLPLIKALGKFDIQQRERLAINFREGDNRYARRGIILAGGIEESARHAESLLRGVREALAKIRQSPYTEALSAITEFAIAPLKASGFKS